MLLIKNIPKQFGYSIKASLRSLTPLLKNTTTKHNNKAVCTVQTAQQKKGRYFKMRTLVIRPTENFFEFAKIDFARRCIQDFMYGNKWMQYDESIKVKNVNGDIFTTFVFIDDDTEKEVYFVDIDTMERIVSADSFMEVYNIVYDIMSKLMSDYFNHN
jgi:hypothetical protein